MRCSASTGGADFTSIRLCASCSQVVVYGLRWRVKGVAFGVWGLKLRIWDLGFGVQGSGFRVQGLGFGVRG